MKDLLLYDTYKALTSIACIILYLIIKHWFSKPTKKHQSGVVLIVWPGSVCSYEVFCRYVRSILSNGSSLPHLRSISDKSYINITTSYVPALPRKRWSAAHKVVMLNSNSLSVFISAGRQACLPARCFLLVCGAMHRLFCRLFDKSRIIA